VIRRFGAAALAALLLFASAASAQAPGNRERLRSGPRAKRDQEIHWRDWGPAAFAEAKRTHRLVLLDLTAVWCHWCHVMDETTYSDSAVIAMLNNEYIPIRVDSDRHPEVRDRYVAGGWPTTAVLSADGHVLAAQTYVPANQLPQMLADVREGYRKNRTELDHRIAEAVRQVRATWQSEPLDTTSLVRSSHLVDQTLEGLVQSEDKEHGGFGGEPRFHDPDAVALLLRLSTTRSKPDLRASALRAVDGLLALQDSVWGGFFRYATKADWTHPHYEKVLWENSGAMESCLDAYVASGKQRYLAAARKANAYVGRWLWDERSRSYFGSQDADVGSHTPSRAFTAGEDYYNRSEVARRRLGIPSVDSTVYADASGRMASTVIRGVLEGAWERSVADRPLRALERLWTRQRTRDGSFFHAMARGRGMVAGLLEDQALPGIAYLDAYEMTGDARHLSRARAIAAWMRDHLEDRAGGGFRYAPFDSTAPGRTLAGDKPPQGNVDAGEFFLRLYWLDDRAEDRETARRTYAWLRSGKLVLEPARALLALKMEANPLRIAVIGTRSSHGRALAEAAYRVDVPDKVIRTYAAGGKGALWGDGVRFPASPDPALYLCGERSCAPPITDPKRVTAAVRTFVASGAP